MSERLNQFGGLPMFAPRARNSDPDTSHAAADQAGRLADAHRAMILEALRDRPMTGDELCARFDWPHATANRRLPELRDAGLVAMTDEKRKTRSGRAARVWRLT